MNQIFSAIRAVAATAATRRSIRSERGASAVEYGIIVMLIASVVVLAVAAIGTQTNTGLDCAAKSWNAKAHTC